MAKKLLFMGDKVIVYLGSVGEPFRGVVLEVSKEITEDVWYKVRPFGEGVAQGRAFWHRETHVKKEKVK